MKHVFISYKREDVEFVFELEQQLKQADVDVWTDAQIQAGQNWRSKIDDALQDAFAVIVVMTPEARTSEYVTYEWAFAMGLGKPIVPLTIT
ncbi:MAG: toll/interleukin-1 receptor domain-containing protein, partial [Chloroflexota bacterium]